MMPDSVVAEPAARAAGRAVEITCSVPRGPAYAGEWIPLCLLIKRPDSHQNAVRVRNVSSKDQQVHFDLDLLDRELEIRPGESYRLIVPLRAPSPGDLDLGQISLQVEDRASAWSDLVRLPGQIMEIRPAIGSEIRFQLDPICSYGEATKVQLTLTHTGSTVFSDVTVNVMPQEVICAGKPTVQRPVFRPGDEEQLELVVDKKDIDVVVVGTSDGQRAEARRTLSVPDPPVPEERRFRFLEPRRLSIDQVAVFDTAAEAPRAVAPVHGTHALRGDEQYQVVIHPLRGSVSRIRVRDIQGRLQVRDAEEDRKTGAWRFLVDVTATTGLFRKPEVLYYDVEGGGEHLTGEISLCLLPPRWTHWRIAGALGVALTLQGFGAIARFLHRADYNLTEALSDFKLREDFHLLFLLSIPVAWLVLKAADWVQYRLRT